MHSFILSLESNLCSKCKRPEIDHTIHATCESCPNIGPCELYSPEPNIMMLLCPDCIRKEEKLRISPEAAQARVNKVIEQSKQIDSQITVRSDIFNAQTVSIHDLKAAIDSDDSIENKHFTLANVLTERMNQFKKAIFELNEEMVNKASEQRAIQVYLNDLSNKLRIEEREKIKLADINYKPNPVKISKPKDIKVIKYDKSEIRKWALSVGVPESVLQMVCIAKKMTPEQAANQLKQSMNK